MLLAVGGSVIEGVVVGAVSAYWLFGRARVPESLGARFLGRTAALELVKGLLLGVVMLATIATVFVAWLLGWNHTAPGRLLFLALIGVMILLHRDLEARIDYIDRLQTGGDAEVAVSDALHALGGEWAIEDNHLRHDGRGNVDHVVCRPDGAWFAIETKSGKYRSRYLGQAISGALAVKKARNVSWVTPVLCVADAEQPTELRRIGSALVWVVAQRNLAEWLPEAPSTRGLRR